LNQSRFFVTRCLKRPNIDSVEARWTFSLAYAWEIFLASSGCELCANLAETHFLLEGQAAASQRTSCLYRAVKVILFAKGRKTSVESSWGPSTMIENATTNGLFLHRVQVSLLSLFCSESSVLYLLLMAREDVDSQHLFDWAFSEILSVFVPPKSPSGSMYAVGVLSL
jgi:hypothetical protein